MRLKMAVLAATTALTLGTMQAQAAPFGPATASIAFLFSPTVTISNSGDTAGFNGGMFVFSTTGGLSGHVSGSGSTVGALSFASTVGVTTPNPITSFLSFADTSGGTFDFTASSVTTQSFSNTPGVSTSIALYVLGVLGDAHLGQTATPTSVTVTLNSTGGSAYSASATLSNPPAAVPPPPPPTSVPEPISLVLLSTALLGIGLMRRRR